MKNHISMRDPLSVARHRLSGVIMRMARTRFGMRRVNLLIPLLILFLATPPVRGAPISLSVQVGAWGDSSSIGNLGVSASILTNSYYLDNSPNPNVRPSPPRGDSFWVGSNLEDGAFIQFGYSLDPTGYYYYGGHVAINGRSYRWGSATFVGMGDARWFWEYFPLGVDTDSYYYQLGPPMSAGANGTWHSYSIVPFHDRHGSGWEFRLDGEYVSSFGAPTSVSKNPIYVAAEHVTTEPPARLGPVEFRDLRFLTSNGWKSVEALYALNGCGEGTPCNFDNPYGVTALGPNHVAAGSWVNQTVSNKELLWPSTFSPSTVVLTTTASPILSTGSTIMIATGLVAVAAIVAVAYKNRKGLQTLTITKKIISFLSLPPVHSVEAESSKQQADRSEEATRSDTEWDEGITSVKLRSRPTKVIALFVLAILHVAVLFLFMRSVFLVMEGHRLGTYASRLYLESLSGIVLFLIFCVLLAFSTSWMAAGLGLLLRTRWGWKLTLVLAAIGIAYSLWILWLGNWFSGILVLIVESLAVYCLTHQDVKTFFAKTRPEYEESDRETMFPKLFKAPK
jgi:hypothetical protein